LLFFPQESCDINASNFTNSLTPLHLAAQRGYSRIIEALIGYGADLSATAGDGQTPLHLILTLKSMQPPSQDAPEFAKARLICIN
jgi:ankyrin repeat protein